MSTRKKIVPINYTSRDFSSIKQDLITYVKRYYPDSYKDFNDASFGSLMLDTVSYIGDILSFYVDYSVNESFMETAIEYDNIIKHARQLGYKFTNAPLSYGICSFYILVPAQAGTVVPDRSYIPVLLKGTKVQTDDGNMFSLVEDVSFQDPQNEVVIAKVDQNEMPTFFAIKAHGAVVSGQLAEHIETIGDYQRFLKVQIPGDNVGEIVTVFDADGNQYYEVDYLSQNIVMKTINTRGADMSSAPSLMRPMAVPRRFVVENQRGTVFLQFGYGSEIELVKNNEIDPSSVVLDIHGKDYITGPSYDPLKLLGTDKFGVAPANTTLYVTYRVNSFENVNAAANSVVVMTEPQLYFQDRSLLREDILNVVSNSIEVTNSEPIVGDITLPTTEEIKRRAIDTFATQNRAITRKDYIASVYSMPAKFGMIKRCAVYRDSNDLKRNLNIYVVSEDQTGALATTNTAIKENLKTWLDEVRAIGDTIDILDAKIFNIGIHFEAIAMSGVNKFSLLNECTRKITEDLTSIHKEVGEPFYITDVFKSLKDVEGLLDVVDVKIFQATGDTYSDITLDISEGMSSDGRFFSIPKDYIWEIKYPFVDIVGVIK